MLLALLVAAPALFNADRPLQAREIVPVSGTTSPQALVEAKLVEPLKQKEAKRPTFSRAVRPPSARRVRILDGARQTDAQGHAFLSFAIDETRFFMGDEGREVPEDAWFKEAIQGCVYPDSGEVIVKMGEAYYPASVLWGTQAKTVPAEVCRSS
jgi:hypothetical protein